MLPSIVAEPGLDPELPESEDRVIDCQAQGQCPGQRDNFQLAGYDFSKKKWGAQQGG